ncbi:MAG TPA: inositol monophosphatase family protein [Polyangiaceae bacterium]|nr:inositol monophosphatase family protein [Polyangiaceae bacterium]
MQSDLLEQLGRVLREVAQAEIVTRFQKLTPSDVISKATAEDPLDLVTAADRAAEAVLTERLSALVPNSTVVGEEAVAADPRVLERLHEAAPVWIVDPLDGTKNFAAGHGPFGTMAALIERGTLLAAGIYLPLLDRNFTAERGLGAFVDGVRIPARAPATGVLMGTAYSRYMPEDAATPLMARAAAHKQLPNVICAAHEYTQIAQGLKDYTLYYRLLPWDHAPGALIVREAGGVVRHPTGRDYHVFDESESTLLSPDEATWQRARSELFG